MANSLGIDLQGKTVILRADRYKGDDKERTFVCEGGFGCRSFTMGQAIIGHFVSDGEECRIDGSDVDRLAEVEQ
jgi:hypothetical protein